VTTTTRADAVGIDGCPGGWVAAIADGDRLAWATAGVAGIAELLPAGAVVGIDMPIGLAAEGWRACDRAAKAELGRAASRVFMTPPRAVLELGLAVPNAEAQEASRRLTGQGVSRQALGLAERILALDACLPAAAGASVVEVHPEISFAELAGRVLEAKTSAAGVGQRMAALRRWLPDVDEVVARAPRGVPIDDALDALAALWSAKRWRSGRARTIPAGAAAAPFIAV
jgi:predicted RNase H-like nuclease